MRVVDHLEVAPWTVVVENISQDKNSSPEEDDLHGVHRPVLHPLPKTVLNCQGARTIDGEERVAAPKKGGDENSRHHLVVVDRN